MHFHEFLERVFCYMALLLTLYYTKLYAREVNENKENARMMREDYKIPLYIDNNGIILSLGQKPAEEIAEEYMMEERCRIQENKKVYWFWDWLKNNIE